MDKEKEIASIGRANEQLFSDQMDIDKRAMDGDKKAVQESVDILEDARALNKYHMSDLEQAARAEMDGELDRKLVHSYKLGNKEI